MDTCIPKVLAYIVRHNRHGKEVLVFRRKETLGTACEVPGGTVEPGEELVTALWREIEEETGLTGLRLISQLAKAPFYADWRGEWQERNVFHVDAPADLPDTWVHTVKAGAEDKGLRLVISWLPVTVAQQELRWGQGPVARPGLDQCQLVCSVEAWSCNNAGPWHPALASARRQLQQQHRQRQ